MGASPWRNSAIRSALPSSGQPLLHVAGIGRVGACLREQPGERRLAVAQHELLDVNAGGHLVDAVDLPDHLLEDPANVTGADEDSVGLAQRRGPPRLELDVAPHRVLELGAVRLHTEGAPVAAPTGAPIST